MRIYLFILFFLCLNYSSLGQNPGAGSGNCLALDGIDDYVTINGGATNNYNLPFTVTAWIKIDAGTTGILPVFSSNDQANTNSGLHFWLTDTTMSAGYGAGATGPFLQNIFYRQTVTSNIQGMWIHVAAVFNSNSISLFLNGVQLGGQLYNTNISYIANNVGTSVVGRKTGASNIDYFKGQIDEVLLWNSALTPVDVRNNMCSKLNPVTSSVFRYFKMDVLNGTALVDNSLAGVNGQTNNGLSLIKSGAAIGDASTYIYQNGSWGGYAHNFGSFGGNNYAVSNVQSNPDGLQMYLVEGAPNSLDTLDWICAEGAYVGVFICRQSTQNYNYNFDFSFNGNTAVNNFISNPSDISLNTRIDNSKNWSTQIVSAPTNRTFSLQSQTTRQEYVLSGLHVAPVIDIPDTITCADSIVISAPQNPVYFYNWSNGAATYQSTYTQAGQHWVQYGDSCGNSLVTDTFQLTLGFSNLDLGNDTVLCFRDSLVLNTNLNFANHSWQDGTSNSTFTVKQPGIYWVEVDFGPCYGSDTVVVSFDNTIPFTLGADTAICFGDSVLLDASISNASDFSWSNGKTSSSIWVSSSGIFSVIAGTAQCFETSSINVNVLLEEIKVSQDTLLCTGQNALLWASGGKSYLWNTGSNSDTILVSPNVSTNYSVIISEEDCSEELFIQVDVTDKIAIAEFEYEINTCKGSIQFINTSTNADLYYWEFGDGSSSTLENPEHEYDQGGFYSVALIASKNSCPDTLTEIVELINLKNIVFFPDAFTPNGDGFNDIYQIDGSSECFLEPNFIIQNRWGKEIFNSKDPFNEFWDGKSNSKGAPQGVYFFSFYSKNYITQGKLTLLR